MIAGPSKKPNPKAMPINAKDLCAIFGRSVVGDVRLGNGEIAGC